MRLRLVLDTETHERLLQSAIAEKRPIQWQAEVILRRALGLPFPKKHLELSTPISPEPKEGHDEQCR